MTAVPAPDRTRLAVLGSPIGHSKSPAIHTAAYRELGLDWRYDAVEVDGPALPGFVATLGETDSDGRRWRGLSLTMPLKRDVLPLLATRTPLVDLVGGANTVTVGEGGELHGANTDVHGITAALREHGVDAIDHALVLGSGATAASVLAAVAELGARSVRIVARTPTSAETLRPLAERLSLELSIARLGDDVSAAEAYGERPPALVVSTLPGGTAVRPAVPTEVLGRAVLLDVAYDPWPSELASQWSTAGGRVVPGIDMLLHQAIGQIRCFVGGDERVALPNEAGVLDRMRESVGGAARAS